MAFLSVLGFVANAVLSFMGGGWFFFFGGFLLQLSGIWLKAIHHGADKISSVTLLNFLKMVPFVAMLIGCGLIIWSGFELPLDIDRNYRTSLWIAFLWLSGFLSTQKKHVVND